MFIDIHTHRSLPRRNILNVENITLGEGPVENIPESLFSAGLHPWYLDEYNGDELFNELKRLSTFDNFVAVGECGFDSLKGAAATVQMDHFSRQVRLAEELNKPVIIHSVKSWGVLFEAHSMLRPATPWMVHGFRGKPDLTRQLASRNIYLSPWAPFVMQGSAGALINSIPLDQLLIETDGFGVKIEEVYAEVASILKIAIEELEEIICKNTVRFLGRDNTVLETFSGK